MKTLNLCIDSMAQPEIIGVGNQENRSLHDLVTHSMTSFPGKD